MAPSGTERPESPELSRAERRLVLLMQLWAVLFAGTGLVFLTIPDFITGTLSAAGTRVGLAELRVSARPSAEEFWAGLAAAMMFTIAYLAFLVQAAPRKNRACGWAIVVAKMASSTAGLATYLLASHALPSLAIFLVDFPIGAITAAFLWVARGGGLPRSETNLRISV